MGITQRRIRVKYCHELRRRKLANPLPVNMKTRGDWIFVNHLARNLSPHHLAKKMGIAQALVLTWEDNQSQPDDLQWQLLNRILA
jgi:ribosome-binding protein aMBF1 (putative translation factor)